MRCCLETLRLTSHAIGAIREAREDFVLKGPGGEDYLVRKGETLAMAHIASSLCPKAWGRDAADYRPARWLLEDGATRRVDKHTLTTFSAGVHKCPGERLALTLMQQTLALLVTADLRLAKIPPVSFERATLAQREGPVHITSRLSPATFSG